MNAVAIDHRVLGLCVKVGQKLKRDRHGIFGANHLKIKAAIIDFHAQAALQHAQMAIKLAAKLGKAQIILGCQRQGAGLNGSAQCVFLQKLRLSSWGGGGLNSTVGQSL